MWKLALIPITLFLASCKTEEEKQVEFAKPCLEAQFTPKQCLFIYQLAKKQQNDSDANRSLAVTMSTMAITNSLMNSK